MCAYITKKGETKSGIHNNRSKIISITNGHKNLTSTARYQKNFLSKPRVLGTKFTEQNRIDDEQITLGLVKTLISTEKDMYRLTKTKFGFSLRPETEGKVILGGNVGQLATGCFMTENPGPKIPRIALETVVEWYRRITHKNGQEAQVVFYWNRDKVTTVKRR